ncbi:MAG: acetate--CoA ligase family protein, partial [Thermoplasmata archaeon]|nr:acetate--CoA ligase family protein [Thermoplasmata archaeon]
GPFYVEIESRLFFDAIQTSPIIFGARGDRPRDTEALSRVVMAISHFMDLFDEVAEMDINPLFVMGRGDGAVAVDGRITLKVR